MPNEKVHYIFYDNRNSFPSLFFRSGSQVVSSPVNQYIAQQEQLTGEIQLDQAAASIRQKLACAPMKEADHYAYSRSMIRVFDRCHARIQIFFQRGLTLFTYFFVVYFIRGERIQIPL